MYTQEVARRVRMTPEENWNSAFMSSLSRLFEGLVALGCCSEDWLSFTSNGAHSCDVPAAHNPSPEYSHPDHDFAVAQDASEYSHLEQDFAAAQGTPAPHQVFDSSLYVHEVQAEMPTPLPEGLQVEPPVDEGAGASTTATESAPTKTRPPLVAFPDAAAIVDPAMPSTLADADGAALNAPPTSAAPTSTISAAAVPTLPPVVATPTPEISDVAMVPQPAEEPPPPEPAASEPPSMPEPTPKPLPKLAGLDDAPGPALGGLADSRASSRSASPRRSIFDGLTGMVNAPP